MARGSSGRIVIEVEPSLKTELYKALAQRELTLKDWFIGRANEEVISRSQPILFDELIKKTELMNKSES